MQTFREVIERWPSVQIMAEDIDRPANLIRKWRERDNIPADNWLPIIEAAKRRRLRGVNADALTRLAGRNGHAD